MIKPQKGLILHNLAVKRGGGGGRGPDRPIPGSANALQMKSILRFYQVNGCYSKKMFCS